VPREQQLAGKAPINRVQRNTNYGEPRKDDTKVELEKLLERSKTNKRSLSQEELGVVEEYFLDIERQKTPNIKQNNTIGYHRSSRTATDLFISEYAEGSSNNKYLEIYNGTGANVDLSSYLIMQASNNGPWDEYVDTLSGALANGDVYVIANSSASDDILAEADLTGSGICYFNGDDARALIKVVSGDTTILDYIGVFYLTAGGDDDPVSGWDVAGVTDGTKDYTLVRKSSVTSGNTSWSASAGTSTSDSEWSVEDRPTATHTPSTLGSHNMVDPALFALNVGFEGSAFPPTGWQAISLNTGNSVTQSSTYPHSGSYAVRFSSYSSGGGSSPDYTQYLISPKLSVASGDSLAFWYRKHYSFYTDNIYVGISTTDSSVASFTFGDALSISTTYARHVQELSSNAGSEIFIALKYYGSYAGHLYVDDITGPGQVISSNPVAALSATTVAFGTVNTSVTDTVSVTLTNNGGANLSTTISSDNTLFTASPATMVLIPGTSGTVNITFSPSAAGEPVQALFSKPSTNRLVVPVPGTAIESGLVSILCVKMIFPLEVTAALGLKVMLTVPEVPGISTMVAGLAVKRVLSEDIVVLKFAPPLFVSVTDTVSVTDVFTVPKATVVADRAATGFELITWPGPVMSST
jgi:hypothetical protein